MGTRSPIDGDSVRGLDAWTSKSLPNLALALGLAKQSRFDPGPDLLLLVHAGVTTELVERWGLVLATDLAMREGLHRPEVARALASDCLGFAGRLRRSKPLGAFALDVGVSKATAGRLRKSLDGLVRRQIEETAARVSAAFLGREPDLPASRHSRTMDRDPCTADQAATEARAFTRSDLAGLLQAKWLEFRPTFLDLIRPELPLLPTKAAVHEFVLQETVAALGPALVERFGAAEAREIQEAVHRGLEQPGATFEAALLDAELYFDSDPRFVNIMIELDLHLLGKLHLATRARLQSEAFALITGEYEPGRKYSAGEVVTFEDEFFFAGEETEGRPGEVGAWEPWWPPTAEEVADEIAALEFAELEFEDLVELSFAADRSESDGP